MKLISHRGNLKGPDTSTENKPSQIMKALAAGYDVEVDVWYQDDQYWLGHDRPQYETSLSFLKNPRLWCHAKNLKALENMLKYDVHCFWHQTDDYVLTSKGFIWTYPNKTICSKSVIMCNDKHNFVDLNCYAICTDYV